MKRLAAAYFMQFVICIGLNVLLSQAGIHLTFLQFFFGSIPIGWVCWYLLGKINYFKSNVS